jgi:hypothetical protein
MRGRLSLRPDLTVVSHWPGVVAHRQTAWPRSCYTTRVEDADFSDEFIKFIQAHVPSVAAAEALIAARGEPGAAAADPTFQAHVKILAQAYEERPVTLIRLIYALRDGKIRSFAEAFNLRKK